jgi:hypothetical protein
MSLGIQPLEDSYFQDLFAQLGRLEIQLDADPLVFGPKRLNEKVALARKMLTTCERMFLDVSQKHATYKRAQRSADLVLNLAMKNLLANDPEVRAGRAVSEREAIATGKLKEEVRDVAAAAQAIEDLDAVLTVIKAKRSDLRDIQGRLRDQIRLCQEEIGLGGRWGSKNPRGVELQPGQGFATGDDVAAIDDVIRKVHEVSDAERHLPAEVDDSDPEAEETASLAASADLSDLDDEDDAPVPVVTPAKSKSESEFIPGADLEAEFGFVPHCEVCGEVQGRTRGGMVCSNGHGGAESVPPATDALADLEATPGAAVGAPSADAEEVTAFLAGVTPAQTPPKKSRYQVEEEDGMDLDSILESFKP